MTGFEVKDPILNSPFEEPKSYWHIEKDKKPIEKPGRRPAMYFYRPPGTPVEGNAVGTAIELKVVNRIRKRLNEWRELALKGEGGVTRTTMELMNYWRREGREMRLFFAQLEAAETIIFLNEARSDFLQGIDVPPDEPTSQQQIEGKATFKRFATKMATGTGKTTVMAMLAAWSILNKMNNRSDARFSDAVLVVCPNVTIKNRLREIDPNEGEASVYRTRDLVPPRLMPALTQGYFMVTNWHIFERHTIQVGGVPARVSKIGVPFRTTETITISPKTTTARNIRYVTETDLRRQIDLGLLKIISEDRDQKGNLKKVKVETFRYVESDTKWLERVLDRKIGSKQNLLIMNDEAHHAYRIKFEETESQQSLFEDSEEIENEEEFVREATVWIEGLDRIHRLRGINFCIDLSATPFYLASSGRDANRPFPWVVSDFGLTDAIESGLTKIPQLAVRDPSGAEIPGYFNIWTWIMPKLTPAEKGGRKGSPKPEAILKYGNHPITMLGALWEETFKLWKEKSEDPRPPVFIIVCKNTSIAKVVYEWLALDQRPAGIPSAKLDGFRNTEEHIRTIRVDTKVIQETDTAGAKTDEMQWMRITLDTVGRLEWPADRQKRPIFPESFEALAQKLDRPLHPPGRDVRCIVSVGMLTEGWDCNTVTHIIGLRPFMSQLLCEQVVGRGLRRANYVIDPEKGKFEEEVAKIFGVPFEIIPFKANAAGPSKLHEKRHHVYAVSGKEDYRIVFPRVEGYTQAIQNRINIDWENEPAFYLDPTNIPPQVQMKASLPTNSGRPTLSGPGKLEDVSLNPFRQKRRRQELIFELATNLTREYLAYGDNKLSPHVLFPQLIKIVGRYLDKKVVVEPPADLMDIFLSPYYGWLIENIVQAIRPNTSQGEAPELPKYERHRKPGSTDEVDFWTSREVREIIHSHLNYIVADTKKWEQSAAYFIDTHPATAAFVKNSGLGFAIPYFHNGQSHDYMPDFIIRLKDESNLNDYLIIETKGFDPLEGIKKAAVERLVSALNTDGSYGHWQYAVVRKPEHVIEAINQAVKRIKSGQDS